MSPDHLAAAMRALGGERWPVADADTHVPPAAGLYAIYGGADAWRDLDLPYQPTTPLYVGKSEDNLIRRELETHFAASNTRRPQTGSSTIRRSFAALLHDALDLHGVPRNPKRPGYFDKYRLLPDADARLTEWMHERLTIAVWAAPANLDTRLEKLEKAIIDAWEPPLNLDGAPRPLPRLKTARKAMAAEAAHWAQHHADATNQVIVAQLDDAGRRSLNAAKPD